MHRDIKPSNLLLDAQGTVWVTDFGLAKQAGCDVTGTGDVVGTLRYMAPERFAGVSDALSDIYGLGVTLYELLTTKPPFQATDRPKLVHDIVHQEPPPLRQLERRVPRLRLLTKAIDFHERMLADRKHDAGARRDLALAYYRLGRLRRQMGPASEAAVALARTIELPWSGERFLMAAPKTSWGCRRTCSDPRL